MSIKKHLDALKKFNTKADKLLHSLFAEFILERKRFSVKIDAKNCLLYTSDAADE